MDVLAECAKLAQEFEGLHDLRSDGLVYPYHDPAGYPTIGYGNLLSYVKNDDLGKYEPKTKDQCVEDLKTELEISKNLAISLSPCLSDISNQWRLVAITDFIFNCGQGNYSMSTLRKCINTEKWVQASQEILKWNKAGGKPLKGLTMRRMAESKMLLKINAL